ncbi:Fasciclin-like arabinogalactan protein 10 [Zostera marina]|uniref:Fasciclin-like arabinogalactan protein 10 n=1 Tax=Zostera marina TaxID=29655 RepID=A0A0K9NKP2_ZOSMR|nr:Fasciclin-like arabinogalactan protein 10 [Zostera marina]
MGTCTSFGMILTGIIAMTILSLSSTAHNITLILDGRKQFSTFNHYLSVSHLAEEINRRQTITVLAVDNAAMNELLRKHLSIYTIKNVLSLHVLADYFGAMKLHQITGRTALVSTLFQATGRAQGMSGFVNITNFRGGKVGFGAEDNDGVLDSFFVKSLKEKPYYISVIQISKLLSSSDAEAPTPAPSAYNLTVLMTKKGCKLFADLLAFHADVEKTFESNIDSGLTVFCPIDQAMRKFMPKYKNLTTDGKTSLLLYHGIPVYNSFQMLKTGNGEFNTLATDGTTRNYNFTVQNNGQGVTLKTRISTATITGTVFDDQPLVIFTVDEVLEPRELFKVKQVRTTAPAPTKAKKSEEAPAEMDDDSYSPDSAPEDDDVVADESEGWRVMSYGGWWWPIVVSVAAAGATYF